MAISSVKAQMYFQPGDMGYDIDTNERGAVIAPQRWRTGLCPHRAGSTQVLNHGK